MKDPLAFVKMADENDLQKHLSADGVNEFRWFLSVQDGKTKCLLQLTEPRSPDNDAGKSVWGLTCGVQHLTVTRLDQTELSLVGFVAVYMN